MEKKLREKQTRIDGKRGGSGGGAGGSAGKKGASAKSTNQRQARKLENQLQLVKYFGSHFFLLRWRRLTESVMKRSGVYPSVCLSVPSAHT